MLFLHRSPPFVQQIGMQEPNRLGSERCKPTAVAYTIPKHSTNIVAQCQLTFPEPCKANTSSFQHRFACIAFLRRVTSGERPRLWACGERESHLPRTPRSVQLYADAKQGAWHQVIGNRRRSVGTWRVWDPDRRRSGTWSVFLHANVPRGVVVIETKLDAMAPPLANGINIKPNACIHLARCKCVFTS